MHTPPITIIAVAERPEDHARGLQGVMDLPPMTGMLFLFWDDPARIREFTMRNTLVPLDIVFVGDGGVVVRVIERVPPLSEDIQSSMYPAAAALEVPAGTCGDLGIHAGAWMMVSKDRSKVVFEAR